MRKNNRFEITYTQGHVDMVQVIVDKETGVNYLFRKKCSGDGPNAMHMCTLAQSNKLCKQNCNLVM